MTELYTPRAADKWQKKAKGLLTAVFLTIGLSLAACILLCRLVNTANAETIYGVVVGISTLAGWTVMLLISLAYLPARAEAAHIRGVMQGEAEELTGCLRVDRQKWVIPGSVSFYKATLTQGEESRTLNLNAALATSFPPQGAKVRLRTVRKFITAYEVEDEKA